ncbi:MAG: M61 family metallopeptidase [Acidobacteria bacterium]|nr:M61 family metallopeptidase [Acidobacteriota bacterium]
MRQVMVHTTAALLALWASTTTAAVAQAQTPAPISYVVRVPAPDTHEAEVAATIPTGGGASVDLMMPTWSPGYYRVEDYAANVRAIRAAAPDGRVLEVEKTSANHWRVTTGGARSITLTYTVFCHERTVTTNWVDADYGVFNGAPTFITLAERVRRRHDVRVELPPGWTSAMTGLADAPGGRPHHFRAADYETLVDSPIVAGRLDIRRFDVAGTPHFIVSAGDSTGWDGERATRDLKVFVEENRRFWGVLPYDKYVFLLLFRPGGGGLEHRNSNLSTVVARPRPRPDGTPAPHDARWPSLGLEAHEYVHLFNVKRLRPVELGPFDFEKAPVTGNLWIAEGVTSYYSGLLMTRAGLQTADEYLASLSSLIGGLQTSPGRLLQSVERSSLEVWENSNSGVAPNAGTVSYYNKGNVLGLLLDAKIRRARNGRASFDDVMRRAYARYGGERGFTGDQFRQTAEEVAGVDLRAWFVSAVSSTDELDYTDVLEWYGLRFVTSEGAAGAWTLERRPDQTPAQRERLAVWLSGR